MSFPAAVPMKSAILAKKAYSTFVENAIVPGSLLPTDTIALFT